MSTSLLLKSLRISNAFIQAPMLGISSPSMVGKISDIGCLGSLPVGGLDASRTRELIRETKSLTNLPFSVNTFVYDVPKFEGTNEISQEIRQKIKDIYLNSENFDADRKRLSLMKYEEVEKNLLSVMPSSSNMASYKEQIDVFIEENIPIISFTFGCMSREDIQRLQKANKIVMGTATNVKEAIFLCKMGVDVICVQGYEAGGHRGTFLEHSLVYDTKDYITNPFVPSASVLLAPPPAVGLFSLLPQVSNALRYNSSHQEIISDSMRVRGNDSQCRDEIVDGEGCRRRNAPLIVAAGGIYSGETVVAAMTLGAHGVQVGSALINTHESLAGDIHKYMIAKSTDIDTVHMNVYSGRYARGLLNRFYVDYTKSDTIRNNMHSSNSEYSDPGLVLPYPLQNMYTTPMRKLNTDGNCDLNVGQYSSIWCGQSSGCYGSHSSVTYTNKTTTNDLTTAPHCDAILLDIIKQTNELLGSRYI